MVNKKGKVAKKSGRTIPILGTVLCVLAITMIVALCLPRTRIGEFTPPPFEENAVSGVPEVAEELCYYSPYQPGMRYRFSVCGKATTEGQSAVVYFTNPAENTVWMKVRLFDESGAVLGESGLLKPGEYVRTIALNTPVTVEKKFTLKIMGYEPQTYLSAGSVTLNLS